MLTRKVGGSALSGSLVVILLWAAGYFWKVQIPPEIAAAITVVVSSIVAYLVPDAGADNGIQAKDQKTP